MREICVNNEALNKGLRKREGRLNDAKSAPGQLDLNIRVPDRLVSLEPRGQSVTIDGSELRNAK